VERTQVYLTKEQRDWLIDNSITVGAKSSGRDGKTQAEHIRDALQEYIDKQNKK
jgi:hypothetical protein